VYDFKADRRRNSTHAVAEKITTGKLVSNALSKYIQRRKKKYISRATGREIAGKLAAPETDDPEIREEIYRLARLLMELDQ